MTEQTLKLKPSEVEILSESGDFKTTVERSFCGNWLIYKSHIISLGVWAQTKIEVCFNKF